MDVISYNVNPNWAQSLRFSTSYKKLTALTLSQELEEGEGSIRC